MSRNEALSSNVAASLTAHREALLDKWTTLVSAELGDRGTRAEIEHELDALLDAVIGGLALGTMKVRNGAYDEARSLLAELSHNRARQGFTPRETAVAIFALKSAYLEVVEPSDEGAHAAFARFSLLVDDLGLFTFETFAAAREQIIADQAEQLLELSTPVVKLWEGIVAVPLVGTLDSARTQVVMEKLLQTLVDTGSEHAIIDITGVPAVDTQVAQHLLKTVVAARLMGAECTISGIRPQIAQTIVALGIEFGDIRTKSTLADALVSALRARGAATQARTQRDG